MVDQKALAKLLGSGEPQGTVLFVAFVPNKDKVGNVIPDRDAWVTTFCELFAELFRGATAMPEAIGYWQESKSEPVIREKTVLVHCYADPDGARDPDKIRLIAALCRRFGRETNQAAVGFLADGWFHLITEYGKGK